MCSSAYHYAHRAYIETLLNFGTDTKQGELTASFWHEDTAGHFDDLTADNVGFTTRRLLGRWRNVIPLMGRVHADLFTQPRMMIDGVDVHIKLTRSPATFVSCDLLLKLTVKHPPTSKSKLIQSRCLCEKSHLRIRVVWE